MFIRFDMIHEREKNRRFHVLQPTFLFPLETPLQLSRNVLHGWKDNSMLAKPIAACTYLFSIVSELSLPKILYRISVESCRNLLTSYRTYFFYRTVQGSRDFL